LFKRLIVVLAMVVGFFVVSPTEPASAALPACGGATYYSTLWGIPTTSAIPTVVLGQPNPDCTMSVGLVSYGVYFMQQALRNCYGQNISADASFGYATREALKNAQRIHGIPDDGVYGPQTRRNLYWATPAGCNRWYG
jgi:peptidoglycan hydrolase-like protein with peptidoglycan-binding domain